MTLLQPLKDPITLDFLVSLAQIVGSLATAGALWVTWRTLGEMRRQSQIATNPHLKMRIRQNKTLKGKSHQFPILNDHYDSAPHHTWTRIISGYLSGQDLSALQDNFIILQFTNVGKSEITKLEYSLHLIVNMLPSEVLDFEVNPTRNEWNKEIELELISGASVLIPITNTRYFPEFSLYIDKLSYSGVRGNKFFDLDGSNSLLNITNETLRAIEVPEISDEEFEMADDSVDEFLLHIEDQDPDFEPPQDEDDIPF